VPVLLEEPPEQLPADRVVVSDEDRCGHGLQVILSPTRSRVNCFRLARDDG
jgi:hypothetical protein